MGDLVAARDEVTGAFGWHEVAALMTREAPAILRLELERPDGATEVLRVTDEHPLYLEGRGWAEAGEVSAGDAVRDREGHPLRVLSVARDETPTRVHNLEVAGAHTYFAGELEAWGHNAGRPRRCSCVDQSPDFAQLLSIIDGIANGTVPSKKFRNREGLPGTGHREFDVPTPGCKDRGKRRLITNKEGQVFYTHDHFAIFLELIR